MNNNFDEGKTKKNRALFQYNGYDIIIIDRSNRPEDETDKEFFDEVAQLWCNYTEYNNAIWADFADFLSTYGFIAEFPEEGFDTFDLNAYTG